MSLRVRRFGDGARRHRLPEIELVERLNVEDGNLGLAGYLHLASSGGRGHLVLPEELFQITLEIDGQLLHQPEFCWGWIRCQVAGVRDTEKHAGTKLNVSHVFSPSRALRRR